MATKTKESKKDTGPSVAERIAAKQALTGAGVPGLARDEVDAYVAGTDGELHIATEAGVLTVTGEAEFNSEGAHQLMRVLEQARQATA